MGVMHKKFPVHGVQFHPESIYTKEGMKLLSNFLNL
jgi:anthranilate synthase component 2